MIILLMQGPSQSGTSERPSLPLEQKMQGDTFLFSHEKIFSEITLSYIIFCKQNRYQTKCKKHTTKHGVFMHLAYE